jgi:hypothetical protein
VTGVEAEMRTRYTYDTVRTLTARCPGVHFVWIMGADNLRSFHRWQKWRAIATSSHRGGRPRRPEPLRGRRNRRTGAVALPHPGNGREVAATPQAARLGLPARPEVAAVFDRSAGAAEPEVTRARVLDELAASVASISLGRPVRVAIDGRTASGKTTLADELAALLTARGRPVIRTSIDGFHRPKAERYARGRTSPEGYYYDSRDLDAVTRLLLAPLGPGGDRRYRTASFDLEKRSPHRSGHYPGAHRCDPGC